MPEAEKIQDNKLVDIDTSGEAVDVELEESKVTPVEDNEEQPEESVVADDAVEESDVSNDVQEQRPTDNGELQDYSDKVQKRIAKLVGKLRESERREEAAMKYAQGLKETKEDEPKSTDKGEHEEYSEKVNKRISKLVGKLRESERREEAALKYAEGLQNKTQELETNLTNVNQHYVQSIETASTSQVE